VREVEDDSYDEDRCYRVYEMKTAEGIACEILLAKDLHLQAAVHLARTHSPFGVAVLIREQ
jgi:hypothetical protein